MAKALDKLSIFGKSKKQSITAPPTTDHLPPENGPSKKQAPPAESVNGAEPRAGTFEKLSAMFGVPGPSFSLPSNNGTAQ